MNNALPFIFLTLKVSSNKVYFSSTRGNWVTDIKLMKELLHSVASDSDTTLLTYLSVSVVNTCTCIKTRFD